MYHYYKQRQPGRAWLESGVHGSDRSWDGCWERERSRPNLEMLPLPRDCKVKVGEFNVCTHAPRYHEIAAQLFKVRLSGTRKRHLGI